MSTTSTVFQLVTQKALRDDAKSGFEEDYALPCSKLYSSFTRTVVNMKIFVCFSFERNDSLIYVFPSSKLSIVCPNPSTVLKTARDSISKNELYQNFWIVSRESYERCDTSQGSRRLLKCNEPLRLKYFTLVFQEYSAVNHPVYIPGEEYYFIGKLSITMSLRARHFNA